MQHMWLKYNFKFVYNILILKIKNRNCNKNSMICNIIHLISKLSKVLLKLARTYCYFLNRLYLSQHQKYILISLNK